MVFDDRLKTSNATYTTMYVVCTTTTMYSIKVKPPKKQFESLGKLVVELFTTTTKRRGLSHGIDSLFPLL